MTPCEVVPRSRVPSYPWFADNVVDGQAVTDNMRALQRIGDPYSEADIAGAAAAVDGKTELDAVVAYLQGLGKHAPRG